MPSVAGFGLDYRMTDLFFDRPAVQRHVDTVARKSLSLIGRNLRQRARRSIKIVAPTKKQFERARSSDRKKRARARATIRERRGRTSQPGQPPLSHQRASERLSIRNILYIYEANRKSVVAGPVKLNGAKASNNVPQTLEEGGTATLLETQRDGQWVVVGARRFRKSKRKKRKRRIKIAARPFMWPALQAEVTDPKFPGVFERAA